MMSVCSPSASIATNAAVSQAVLRERRTEHGERPGHEEQPADEPRVDAELGVGRLARLDARAARALRGRARIPGPVALRVAEHGLDAVAEVAEMARGARVLEPGRAHRRAGTGLVGVGALVVELGRGEARAGSDVRVGLHEAEPDHDRRDGGEHERHPPLRPQRREHEEPERERDVRAARVRPEEPGGDERRSPAARPGAAV